MSPQAQLAPTALARTAKALKQSPAVQHHMRKVTYIGQYVSPTNAPRHNTVVPIQ